MKTAKKCTALILAAAFLLLCGCEGFITDTDKILTPPALTGEMQPISEALSKSVSGEYMLVYPSSGDIRSAIALCDVEGDGVNEAFAFYTVNSGDVTEMHINFIRKLSSGWKSVADSTLQAGGIDKIEFCDLSGDGNKEVLVGWEIYGSGEKKLGVYSAKSGKLTERLMENYTNYACCDLSGDGKDELFLQYLNPTENSNVASIFAFTKAGFSKTAGCLMDGKVKSAGVPVLSKLTDGTPALFIDEEKGVGSVSEVLFMQGDELINPLFDGNKGENTVTQRALSLACTDINSDGYLEIPTSIEMPSADKTGDKAYYTNWCGYNGDTLTVKTVTVMNQTDGYYVCLPSKLISKTALSRNVQKRSRTFYEYDDETAKTGRKLFTITAVELQNEDSFKKENKNAGKLAASKKTVFYAELYEAGEEKMTFNELKDAFKITQ